MDIMQRVRTAVSSATAAADQGDTIAKVHRNRSQAFVRILAHQLRKGQSADADTAVLSRDHYNRRRFGLNELLYDITICRYGTCPSPSGKHTLTYVTTGMLALESEFDRNPQKGLHDFNKLMLSNARHKVFIGPLVDDGSRYLRALESAARACVGHIAVILITHPSEWQSGARIRVSAWVYHGGQWQPSQTVGVGA